MGDIADWLLGSQDPFDCDDDFEWQSTQRRPRSAPQPKTCMRCGVTGLWWGTLGDGRWTLTARDGNPHVCDTAASPDEF